MTKPRDEEPALERDDERFVERLAAHYAPKPIGAARRAALDEELRSRLERRSRSRTLAPLLAAAALAAALAWVALPGLFESSPGGEVQPPPGAAELAGLRRWEQELFYETGAGSELDALAEEEDAAELPEDYLAIASVFLGG